MRLAILGGSFNPIHLGHLFLADAVLCELHYDRVILVPAFQSPFKLAAPGMDDNARDRLEMIAASIAGDHRLTVDDCEIRRKGISYTIDTVSDIIRRYLPEGKPGLIIGDDLAGEFPDWHKSDEILAAADIIIARRQHSGKLKTPFPCTRISNDVMEISSAMVREKISANAAWRYLIPAPARTIIEDRGLYGVIPKPASAVVEKNLIIRVENAARESLSIERFLHSRNTALLARDMCCCSAYGIDPDAAYLAGIAHDLGKQLGEKELLKLAKSDGHIISRLEKDKPSLLHGRASAVLLRERFNVHNESILEAAALHTMGGRNMGPLAKVIYIADKMEVSREKADPELRKLLYQGVDLDKMFTAVLNQTVSWLRAKKLTLSEETVTLLAKMRRSSE